MIRRLALVFLFLIGFSAELQAACTTTTTQLCLNGGRFKVTSTWKTPAGQTGVGQALGLTADTGYFWFFSPSNVEAVVKVLNGCALNNRHWVFAGGLTDVETTVRVEDTATGVVKTYQNPQLMPFQPVQDTGAFATCSTSFEGGSPSHLEENGEDLARFYEALMGWGAPPATPMTDEPEAVVTNTLTACSSPNSLCLNQGRFEVTASWQTPAGATGTGHPNLLTSDTGYFWFFSSSNIELVVKVLDGCGLNQRYWVFAGGLTNVQVNLTVRDTVTGATRTYLNPQNTPFQPIQDTSAFGSCPGAGSGYPGKDPTVAPLPVLSIDPPSPAGNGLARVRVNAPGASSITVTASGAGCGSFGNHSVSGSVLDLSRQVAAFGQCQLVASLTGTTPATQRASFTVEPTELLLPPVEMVGGIFRPGSLPAATGGSSAPNIGGVNVPGTLINGGTVQMRIELSNPSQAANVSRILVKVPGAPGFDGYFEAPVRRTGNTLLADLRLDADFSTAASAYLNPRFADLDALDGSGLDILVQLIDYLGHVGDAWLQHFQTQEVGSNEVQVSLSWDTPTDVDLHVVEPAPGEEIYYGNTSSTTGGRLDLDSNAGCSLDFVNNENVAWPQGAPLPGQHIVRVDYWANCGGFPANYVVTTKVCGVVSTFTGSFSSGQEDHGGGGSGREITRFTPNCAYRVRGKATYEDRAQTLTGLATATTKPPIRFARVEVRRASDNSVLATGSTKQDGTFDVSFQNSGPAGYYVAVLASQDNDIVKQVVKNNAGASYVQRSAGTIDERASPDRTGLMIEALASQSAPAFNIFDVGVVGAQQYRRIHGITPPQLNWLWTRGDLGDCDGDLVSCYDRGKNQISVLSAASDPDEYDDLVLLHEYGHKWQYERSRSNSPGGDHSAEDQVDPLLAWGEGSATFFGNLAKGTPTYLDTRPGGAGHVNIESLAGTIPLGTSTGDQNGDVSEAVVAAVMWDLADSTNETSDTLSNEQGVFLAATYLGSGAFADRATSGADLVDFLDGWFCKGNGSAGDADEGVRGNVVGIHQFPYDFANVGTCP